MRPKEKPTIDSRRVKICMELMQGMGCRDDQKYIEFDCSMPDFLTFDGAVHIYDGYHNWVIGTANIAWMTFDYYEEGK